jgi:hypothetical protein
MLIPLFDYDKHRIIMETSFRFEGKKYIYFPDGVKFYSLYRTKRKINSFSELEYIAEKFNHLNPEFDPDLTKRLFCELADRGSGHIIRTYGEGRVEAMVDRVMAKNKEPYCPRLRKILFNPNKMLSRTQKMQIVGSLISAKERPPEEDIAAVIEDLWIRLEKITITRVAQELNTTRHLVRWYFTDEIMSSVRSANQEIRQKNIIAKCIEAIDILTEGGNRLKMRELKKLTSVRDYFLLKKSIVYYQDRI